MTSAPALGSPPLAAPIGLPTVPRDPRPVARLEAEDHAPIAPPAATSLVTPAWLSRLPSRLFFVDVETTGLHRSDRIVSFAGILLTTKDLAQAQLNIKHVHLLFDPGRKSHPEAETLHGYDDWTLRHQAFFSEHATVIRELFDAADLIVAHNAEFDIGFINREFEALGESPIGNPIYCTMQAYRQTGYAGRASLDAIAHRIGLVRAGKRHGAFEDAWLTMMVYLWLNECPYRAPFNVVPNPGPANMRPVPPMPPGDLPARKRRPRTTKRKEA